MRDARDTQRSSAPLKPAEDAYQFDTSSLTIDEVVAQILDWYRQRRGCNSLEERFVRLHMQSR
jgi:cytidylate kinase